MRIRQIKIKFRRHFENIELNLDEESGLVCVVGANGTGKSHLLELIAACAHAIGLSPGIEKQRSDPFSDLHEFMLKFDIDEGVSEIIDKKLIPCPEYSDWDRTITISSKNTPETVKKETMCGGIVDQGSNRQFSELIVRHLSESKEVNFVFLDANRAYPKKNINVHEIANADETDWTTAEYTRGRSFKETTTLYEEWIKYFLAKENQSGNSLIRKIRIARLQGMEEPKFEDHFEKYKNSLQIILKHLVFTGVDSKKRTLLFDTTGLELSFDQLSGGEREIAFLVGQIDRFGLRRGLFLLDEPELHLNADLIRSWVEFLTSTVETGQIWLATHSLEAVEAAGQHATFVLERSDETRNVDRISRLDDRPVLSVLSRAVGTPAFSISQLLFVFVEGEEGVGERERFRKLAALPQDIRFLESGSCTEVIRKVESLRALAHETDTGIRIGGIVDRDFRSETEAARLSVDRNIFVLPVHEAENFFLHPPTLRILLNQHGRTSLDPLDLIRAAADARAGSWIFQHMDTSKNSNLLAA